MPAREMPGRAMQAKVRIVWRPGYGDTADVARGWAEALEDGRRIPAAGVSAVQPGSGPEETATLLLLVRDATTPTEGLAVASQQAARVIGDDPRVSEIRGVAAWPVP